jgi:hypothetical protein
MSSRTKTVALGHSQPGPTSGRPPDVCYASDRYRNDEPLKPTRMGEREPTPGSDAVDTVITVNQHFDELSCFE